jgi:succinylglutamate desuccinylase
MSAASFEALPESVRALAEADFGTVAQRFRDAGFVVGCPPRAS